MSTSLPRASDLGVGTVGDQTSALNTIFANSAYSGVIIDFSPPVVITISGTLDCQNKQMIFVPGCTLTGGGTISNVVINAGYRQQIADTTIKFTNASTLNEKFSVMWYGALTNGTDARAAIQQSIDTVVANSTRIRTVFFPSGLYTCNEGILVYSWNGTTYDLVSVRLEGENTFWPNTSTGTYLIFTQKNTFGLGIHLAKGVEVIRLGIKGGFTSPTYNTHQFYNTDFSVYTDTACRDKRYSPYAGIVIDPFCDASHIPSDGGYPVWNTVK